MKLWFAFRFTDLPFIALGNEDAPESIVVTEKKRVIWVSAVAAKAGAELGMDVTTAQLLSNCEFYERDGLKEGFLLKNWAEKLYSFSPHIEIYACQSRPHSGLLLEVSTCLALFGRTLNLLNKIVDSFNKDSISIAHGIANTKNAAWLLSFAEVQYSFEEIRNDYINLLEPLPIQLMHDHAKTVEALEQMGFNTFGDLANQIQRQTVSGIKKRFGKPFTDYICSVFDIDIDFQQSTLFSKPVDTYKPVEFFSEELEFEYPTNNTALMEVPIQSLLKDLSDYMRKRQFETQEIQWILSDIHKGKEYFHVFADSPQSHWQLFYDLTMIQLDNREFSFEVDTLGLKCENLLGVQTRNNILAFDKEKRRYDQDFAITAAKLKARLGDNAVYKLSYQEALLPELSQVNIPLNAQCNQNLPAELSDVFRPSWLMEEPIPIDERAKGLYWRGYLTILVGPERIQGNWLGDVVARDYFVAVRHDHLRIWIFKNLYKNNWFVHGIFG